MSKIIAVLKKNFKLILRSRTSSLIILFGPLLIMLIVGFALNNASTLNVNIGYYAYDNNNLTASFIDALKDNSFRIELFESENQCKDSVETGNKHICIIFPPDFRIANNKTNNIIFYVDNSKISLVNLVIDAISKKVSTRSIALTTNMTMDILDRLNYAKTEIYNKTSYVDDLINENSEQQIKANSALDSVSRIVFNFDKSSYNTSKLSGKLSSISSENEDAWNEAKDAIEDTIDVLDGLRQYSHVNETIDDLEDTLSKLGDHYNDSVDYIGEATDIIQGINKKLSDVEDSISYADSKRDETKATLSSLKNSLNQSLSKINTIKQTFSNIYVNLESAEVTSAESIVRPITTKVMPVVSTRSQLSFMFPGLVMLIVMFIGILLSSTLVVMEKTSKAHFRNFITPTRDITFIIGIFLTTFIILAFQIAVIFSFSSFYFNIDFTSNIYLILLVLFIMISFFSMVGMIIGNIFNTQETNTLATMSIASILLFISDLIFPLENLPRFIADMARNYNPFVIGDTMLRKIIILNVKFNVIKSQVYIMLAYIIISFVVLLLINFIIKRRFLLKYAGYLAKREYMKQRKEIIERELLTYLKIDPKNYFITKDNIKITSLESLLDYLQHIDDLLYNSYVREGKNPFSSWVSRVLRNDELSIALAKAKTRRKSIKVLKKAIRRYNAMERRIQKIDDKILLKKEKEKKKQQESPKPKPEKAKSHASHAGNMETKDKKDKDKNKSSVREAKQKETSKNNSRNESKSDDIEEDIKDLKA